MAWHIGAGLVTHTVFTTLHKKYFKIYNYKIVEKYNELKNK